jgi:hypothetical protein
MRGASPGSCDRLGRERHSRAGLPAVQQGRQAGEAAVDQIADRALAAAHGCGDLGVVEADYALHRDRLAVVLRQLVERGLEPLHGFAARSDAARCADRRVAREHGRRGVGPARPCCPDLAPVVALVGGVELLLVDDLVQRLPAEPMAELGFAAELEP